MKVLICLVLFLLTACYYRKVQVNAHDRTFIPYLQTNYLVFVHSRMDTDTLLLEKKLWRSSNLDFYIDRKLHNTTDTKLPYYETYSSEISLARTNAKVNAGKPYIKYSPFIFTFYKYQSDTILALYYHIDGRWRGTIRFDTMQLDSVHLSGKFYGDVISVKTDSADLFPMAKMYWSLKYGLIQIEEKNGEKWTIANIVRYSK